MVAFHKQCTAFHTNSLLELLSWQVDYRVIQSYASLVYWPAVTVSVDCHSTTEPIQTLRNHGQICKLDQLVYTTHNRVKVGGSAKMGWVRVQWLHLASYLGFLSQHSFLRISHVRGIVPPWYMSHLLVTMPGTLVIGVTVSAWVGRPGRCKTAVANHHLGKKLQWATVALSHVWNPPTVFFQFSPKPQDKIRGKESLSMRLD